MKKILKYIIPVMAVVSIAVSACSMGDMEEVGFNIALGTLKGSAANPQIELDDYKLLNIDEVGATTSWNDVQDKYQEKEEKNVSRVYINYTILKTNNGSTVPVTYSVRLNRFYQLLVKNIKTLSAMPAAERTALGDDPIKVRSGTVGGGYINLSFDIYFNPESSSFNHTVELVYDDENYKDGYTHLELRHAGEAVEFSRAMSETFWASFAIPEAISSVDDKAQLIKLHWKEYDQAGNVVDRVSDSVFSPYGNITKPQEVGEQQWTVNLQ